MKNHTKGFCDCASVSDVVVTVRFRGSGTGFRGLAAYMSTVSRLASANVSDVMQMVEGGTTAATPHYGICADTVCCKSLVSVFLKI